VPPHLSRKAENELDTRLTPRVINRFRLRALHDCKIRCRLQESLPLAPTTERLRKPRDLRGFREAAEGTRTLDLLHGKQTL
jgi:hypothetical protein